MLSVWLENLIAYSLQIAVIATVGALLLHLLRIQIPRVRLLCWQGLIVACLLLPAMQPWLPWKRTVSAVQISSGPAIPIETGRQSKAPFPVTKFVLWIVGAGAAIRFGMLGLGFWRIRRYRRNSTFVAGAFQELQRRMGVFADFQASNDVAGPVTFGLLHPVILLPETCLADESIACHELVHVRRRDWLFTVIEECVLSLFWFHPAMWWLIAEIQLAREQAVDREVVTILNSREQYLEALLALAAGRAGFDLIPASPFLRKRHLQKRVASLLKEVSMSKLRLSSSLAAFVAALALAGWLGVKSFPLQAAPQEKIDAPGVTVQPGAPTLLHRVPVVYPKQALAKRIQGTVVVELSLNETGAVSDARALSGPEELRKAALQSVLQWHYDSKVATKTQATVDFRMPEETKPSVPSSIVPAPAQAEGPGRIRVGGNVQAVNLIQKVTPVYPPLAKQARIQGVVRFTVTIGKDGKVLDIQLVSGHPLLVESAREAVAQWVYKPTLLNGNPVEVVTQVDVNYTLSDSGSPAAPAVPQ